MISNVICIKNTDVSFHHSLFLSFALQLINPAQFNIAAVSSYSISLRTLNHAASSCIVWKLLPSFFLSWQIETIFKGKACTEIKDSALGLTKRLAQTAQETFGDFEEAVEKDATKTAVSDGTVHPLTSYVINYVKFLFE